MLTPDRKLFKKALAQLRGRNKVAPAATGHIAHSVNDPHTVDLCLHSRWMKLRSTVPPRIVSEALVLEKGRPDVFIAGDSAHAKADVAAFIGSIGLRPLDVGGLKMAHWLEGMGVVTVGGRPWRA